MSIIRPEFKKAVNLAKRTGAPLVMPDVSHLGDTDEDILEHAAFAILNKVAIVFVDKASTDRVRRLVDEACK